MPALPWTSRTAVGGDDECVVMASRLPLAHYRHIPAFLAATMAIRRQLAAADGLIGYALDAHLMSRTFWTVSAWQSREALDAFSRANPHSARVSAIRPRMQPTTFTFWTCPGSELPVHWHEVRRRIAEEAAT
jgi:quinol monooxygenase YgiN